MALYDVCLYGATSFVGQLAAEYLATKRNVKWAIGGRSEQKLRELKARLPTSQDIEIVTADAMDKQSIRDNVVSKSKCVLSFAGPYEKVGKNIVDECANQGTDYVDITGEASFIKRSVVELDMRAKRSSAMIVHSCGFDCIPWDISNLVGAEKLHKEHNVKCLSTDAYLGSSDGGISGGTLESLAGQIPEMRKDKALSSLKCLAPGEEDKETPQLQKLVNFSKLANQWTAPSIFAPVNARIIYRSSHLCPGLFAKGYAYNESTLAGGLIAASIATALTGLGATLTSVSLARNALKKVGILPEQGDGPPKSKRENGFFNTYLFLRGEGKDPTPPTYMVHCAYTKDPGYASTAVMAVDAALVAAQSREECPGKAGGVLTPATALGNPLCEKLRSDGFTFDVYRIDPEDKNRKLPVISRA